MRTIKIDKHITVPEAAKHARSGQTPIYPWEDLKVGDSFFVATELNFPKEATVDAKRIRNAAMRWARVSPYATTEHGKRRTFKVLALQLGNQWGVRTWRDPDMLLADMRQNKKKGE